MDYVRELLERKHVLVMALGVFFAVSLTWTPVLSAQAIKGAKPDTGAGEGSRSCLAADICWEKYTGCLELYCDTIPPEQVDFIAACKEFCTMVLLSCDDGCGKNQTGSRSE